MSDDVGRSRYVSSSFGFETFGQRSERIGLPEEAVCGGLVERKVAGFPDLAVLDLEGKYPDCIDIGEAIAIGPAAMHVDDPVFVRHQRDQLGPEIASSELLKEGGHFLLAAFGAGKRMMAGNVPFDVIGEKDATRSISPEA